MVLVHRSLDQGEPRLDLMLVTRFGHVSKRDMEQYIQCYNDMQFWTSLWGIDLYYMRTLMARLWYTDCKTGPRSLPIPVFDVDFAAPSVKRSIPFP